MVKAALIQMSTELEKEKNVQKAENLVREAAAKGAKILCLQELFNTIYFPYEIDNKYLELAEPIPGPTTDRMQAVAQEEGVVVVTPIFEKTVDGLYFNSAPVVGSNGELLGVYRKSAIPIASVPSIKGFEKYYFAPGNTGFMTFETPFGVSIGILVCYDRHFPEAARVLALQGAQVLLVPSATAGRSRDIWELELRAHAAANGYFVGGVNRVGLDVGGSHYEWYGSSLWVDPKGQVISQAGDSHDETLYAELDLSTIPTARMEWGFLRDRRPDLYGDLAKSSAQSVEHHHA
jgi:beta-ureidopropionase